MFFLLGFYGTYKFTRDSKGRIQIPSQFRKMLFSRLTDSSSGDLDEKDYRILVITEGSDGCIMAFAPSDWGFYMDEMLEIEDMDDEDHLDMMRQVLSLASNVTIDSQWRLKVPEMLVKYAKLDSEVEIIGHIDRIEIWDPEVRRKYMNREKPDKSKVIKKLFRPKSSRQRVQEEKTDLE